MATNTTVQDSLALRYMFVEGTCGAGSSYNETTRACRTIPTLSLNQGASLTTATVLATGNYTNTATTASTPGTPTPPMGQRECHDDAAVDGGY